MQDNSLRRLLRPSIISAVAAIAVCWVFGATGCGKSSSPEEAQPGKVLTTDGKPAPPEAEAAMKAGNGGPKTGPKGKSGRGGPPD